jgi:hypothetical protein
MTLELPEPHINQERIYNSTARFRVVMCGRRFGKSELSQVEIITAALNGQSVAYITPTYALAETFFSKLVQRVPFPHNVNKLLIEYPTGGTNEFFTGERLDNLRGRKFHLCVIDEAAFINNLEEGWLNAIRPTLTDYKGRALFLSTPKGKKFFHSLYLKGLNKEQDWESFKFSTYDNPHIEKSEIDSAKKELPEHVFNQEYMADPSDNSANPFGYTYIRQCIYPISPDRAVCYGIDLGKSVDYTVIIGLDKNGSVCYFDRFQKDWRQTKNEIMNLKRAPILIDSTGVGDPIFEELRKDGLDITGYKFSATTKQQLMEGIASAIQQRKISYPEGAIVYELEMFEYQYSNTGVKYSAPKGFHDDCVMSLALAWSMYSKNAGSGRYIIV